MTTRLSAILEEIERDPSCRAILLTGAGRGFCAGQDLSERSVAPGDVAPKVDVGHSIETRFNPLVRKLRAMPKPVIVAVNGVAAGAGASFAMLGDITLAARSATFIQSFVKIGLIPDCGGTWLLTQRLGEARAKALAMLAEPVTAEQAAAWGLIWKMVDDADLMPEARKLAAHLATQSAGALAAIKRAVQFATDASMDASLESRARRAARTRLFRGFRRGRGGVPGEAGAQLRRRALTRGSMQDLPEEHLRPLVLGVGEEWLRRVDLDDLAVVHEHDPVRDLAGEPHLMGHDQHRHALSAQAR